MYRQQRRAVGIGDGLDPAELVGLPADGAVAVGQRPAVGVDNTRGANGVSGSIRVIVADLWTRPSIHGAGMGLELDSQLLKLIILVLHVVDDISLAYCRVVIAGDARNKPADFVGCRDAADGLVNPATKERHAVVRWPAQQIVKINVRRAILIGRLRDLALAVVAVGDLSEAETLSG